MSQFDIVVSEEKKLSAALAVGFKNIQDKLAVLIANQGDPADAAAIAEVVSDLQAMEASVAANDPGPQGTATDTGTDTGTASTPAV